MIVIAALVSLCAAGPVLQVPFDDEWSAATQGAWTLRVDHRALLAMRHPAETPEPTAAAVYMRTITLPAEWTGPVTLHAYCSDDVDSPQSGQSGARRKQILIDGEVVWSNDVCGDSSNATLAIPLPPGIGKTFTLTLLGFNTDADDAANAEPFASTIYWGGIAFAHDGATPPPQTMPSVAKVREVHARRWPLGTFATTVKIDGVEFQVLLPDPMPKQGFPLTMGLPIPPSRVLDPSGLRFRADGKTVPLQASASGWWPDESIQWLLCDFVALPGMTSIRVESKKSSALPDAPIDETDTGIHVGGAITYTASLGRMLHEIRAGNHRIEELTLRLDTGGAAYPGTADEWLVWDRGPVRTTLLAQGVFPADPSLPFHLYVSSYAGLPYLKLWLRVFNTGAHPVPISGLRVALTLPDPPPALTTSAGALNAGESLVQTDHVTRTLADNPVDPNALAFAAWDHGVVTTKHFRERFPRAFHYNPGTLSVDCIAGEASPVYIQPGEASSHEIWLALGDVDPEAFANAVAHPPLLSNPDYVAATGAFGPANTLSRAKDLAPLLSALTPVPSWDALEHHFGSRDFPDEPFIGGLPRWSNNYYERMLGLWSAWLLTGERGWFEHALDTCEHLMDVSVIHSDVPGKDWRGAMHGPGENHTPGPWNPLLRAHGLSLFHQLTGRPEAREAVHALTEFCMRARPGMHGPNPRHQAGPLDTIATSYMESGEIDLLDHGGQRVEAVADAIDMRRGVWLGADRADGTHNPAQAAQLARALYLWYRATGDVAAAEALVAMADAILCEHAPWDGAGVVTANASETLLVLPALFAAHELTEDAYFLEHARAELEAWLETKPQVSPLYGFWHTPWLAWYLAPATENPE